MTRARRSKAKELTESWDSVNDSYSDETATYTSTEERDELGDEYQSTPRANGASKREDTPRRRTLRSSVEPELVMPLSPDAGKRASTPHMRMNQRSLTSDAGEFRKKQRSATPRTRMSERSMTGDAGRFKSSRLKEHDEAEYESEEEELGGRVAAMAWQKVFAPVLSYCGGIASMILQYAKPLIAFCVAAYLIAAVGTLASNFLRESIQNALSPICRLPLTGNIPFCADMYPRQAQGAAEFDKLVQAQDAFQDVLANSAVGTNLPLDMKRSEAGIRDLKHVVQYSALPSKNELVFEFGGFIDTARQASQDLSKFNSRIGRAVDHILSTNRWTLSVIDGVTAEEAAKGALSKWVSRNLNIFAPFQPMSLSRDVLLDQYLRHTGAVEEQILSLIDEALALRDILENLDGRLDVIQGIVYRDGTKIEGTKDELFAALWTKLGGNRSSVSKLNNQLKLLKDVNSYRRAAWGHVTSTLVKLQEIQHSLEDLRERVALPETVGTHKVPLEVHIESMNLGIERLEGQRDASRALEQEKYARIMAKGDAANERARMIDSDRKEL